MFRFLAPAIALLTLAGVALADDADPTAPVQKILQISQGMFKDSDPAADDYFSDKWMPQLFSSAFVTIARKGFAKAQANDEPFIDYDPVIGGQDGCQPKDLTITNTGQKDGAADVVARFRATYCFEGSDNAFTETHFKVVQENGQARIDDIVNIVPEGDPISLRETMNSYFTAQ
jgi:hypothetical protein